MLENFVISPDSTESSADGEEWCSNRSSSPIEKVCQTSSSELLVILKNTARDQGDTDDDGGEEIGELEIELEPWLTGGLYCTRHTKVKKGNRISMTHYTFYLPVSFILLLHFLLNSLLFILEFLFLSLFEGWSHQLCKLVLQLKVENFGDNCDGDFLRVLAFVADGKNNASSKDWEKAVKEWDITEITWLSQSHFDISMR